MSLHPTAIIDPSAELGDVQVGPYAVIEAGVQLADGVVVGAHAVIQSGTRIGPRTVVGPHAVLGGPPQDRKHDGSATSLEIGADNVFREFTSAHRGSSSDTGITRIGDDNYFMASSHVAHDCVVGSGCMFANSAAIGGHCEIGDGVVLGGLVGVHQHVRIGRLAMVGGGGMCAQDVPPFTLAQGDRARLFGVNVIGLKRAGFSLDTVNLLKNAWRTLFTQDLPTRAAISQARKAGSDPTVEELVLFVESSARGVCRTAGRR